MIVMLTNLQKIRCESCFAGMTLNIPTEEELLRNPKHEEGRSLLKTETIRSKTDRKRIKKMGLGEDFNQPTNIP